MKLIFMGTPQLAVAHLEAVAREHEVLCVVTQPDKPVQRGHKTEILPSPVKRRAQELGMRVVQPERARNPEFVEEMRALRPEAMVVVAYGQILPQALLDLPQENFAGGGCINVHFSLLPRWRGAAPVQYAIWHGDRETGVTTQWMAAKLDAGDLLPQEHVAIEPEESSGELLERLTPPGARLLVESLRLMQEGRAPRAPQDETQVTLAPQIERDMARLDWTLPACELRNMVRAFSPWPVAWCRWRDADFKIHRARAANSSQSTLAPGELRIENGALLAGSGQGALQLLEVQPAGRPKLDALDWARGARLDAGTLLN